MRCADCVHEKTCENRDMVTAENVPCPDAQPYCSACAYSARRDDGIWCTVHHMPTLPRDFCQDSSRTAVRRKMLYVIGPVSGRPGLNLAAFEAARDMLEAAGYDVRIPHSFVGPTASWGDAMRVSLIKLLSFRDGGRPLFDGVAYIPGESKGAALERHVCEELGIPCKEVGEWM